MASRVGAECQSFVSRKAKLLLPLPVRLPCQHRGPCAGRIVKSIYYLYTLLCYGMAHYHSMAVQRVGVTVWCTVNVKSSKRLQDFHIREGQGLGSQCKPPVTGLGRDATASWLVDACNRMRGIFFFSVFKTEPSAEPPSGASSCLT